jgi:hypothetical protein
MSPDQTVGVSLLAIAVWQATHISLMSRDKTVGVSLLAIAV